MCRYFDPCSNGLKNRTVVLQILGRHPKRITEWHLTNLVHFGFTLQGHNLPSSGNKSRLEDYGTFLMAV